MIAVLVAVGLQLLVEKCLAKYADVLWREAVGHAATGLYSTAQLVEQKRSALVSRRLVWMTPLQLSQRDGFIMRY
jgi:hypothetical protein